MILPSFLFSISISQSTVHASFITVVSNLFGIRDQFHERYFFHGPGLVRGWFQDDSHKEHAITLLTKVRLVKAMVFPVVMYGCESWTIKEA